jgi:hypothetical protein
MSTMDVARHVQAEDQARARRMTETTLEGWELLSWNELLADDVVLSLKLGAVDASRLGELDAAGGDLEATGRDEAKDVLRAIYSDLRKDLTVTTKVISGYEAILLGCLAVPKAGQDLETLPVGIYMAFNSHGKIREMTIAIVDLRAATDAMRNAVRNGAAGKC